MGRGLETMSIECVVTTRYVQGWADSVCVTVLGGKYRRLLRRSRTLRLSEGVYCKRHPVKVRCS
jgi:hypothetical protein